MKTVSLLVLVLLASACATTGARPADDVAPHGIHVFTPPAHYRALFDQLVARVGSSKVTFDDIIWYRTPGLTFSCAYARPGADRCFAQWLILPGDVPAQAIIVGELSLDNDTRVQHELLHAITQDGRHTRLFLKLGLLDGNPID